MPYDQRPGMEAERLSLIWDIYQWCGSQASGKTYYGNYIEGKLVAENKNRERGIAWDLAQIFGAIAGGYVIELSPHYKGVQTIRRNKAIWEKVSKFVKLKTGYGCLPYDPGDDGERWESINGVSFFNVQS